MEDENPSRILSFQLEKAKSFIEDSISKKLPRILIIHGKGEGVLKIEIIHLLKGYTQIKFIIPKNIDGASEVWL